MIKQKNGESGQVQSNQLANQKIAYVLGRFPALSETFVIREILELERQGIEVRIFSLFNSLPTKSAKAEWNGQASVTCLSYHSILFLLLNTIRYFFRAPLRFARTFIVMLGHYRWRFLIGCRVLLFATYLATEFERDPVTHMHAHFASECTSVAQFTYLLTNTPYSFTAHANDIYLSSEDALAFKLKMARFVVTISAYNQKYLRSLVDQKTGEHIHLIYNGLDLHNFPLLPSEVPLSNTPALILSVCRLVEKKGLVYLLGACRILADQGYAFSCHIVGDGPLYPALEQKIRELDLSDRVILLGSQTPKQVTETYQKATIMALPCIITNDGDRDGIPTVLIESLYMGIPSVSTPISGIPELIISEANGLLVPPKDSAALATALAHLIDNPSLRSRFAASGRATVLKQFNMANNVQHLIDLFSSKLGEIDH